MAYSNFAIFKFVLFAVLFSYCRGTDQKISLKKTSVSPFKQLISSQDAKKIESSNPKPLKSSENISQQISRKVTTVDPKETFVDILKATRDEVVDIFDSLAFAETNKERLENLVEIADRHKTFLGSVSVCLLLRKVIRPSDAAIGAKVIEDLRRKEAMKWGVRVVK